MNRRNYNRYRRYGAAFDPEVFRLPLTDSVLIEMAAQGFARALGRRYFQSWDHHLEWTTEAPDETAHGALDGLGRQGGSVLGPGGSGLSS